MERRSRGTVIFHYHKRHYKVLSARTRGDGNYTFECIDLKTKNRAILKLNLSGYLEAMEKALPAMKSPKDIFYLDRDNKGIWK